ncbi:hypothetical protein B0I35DRAFT_474218 [Stachybotrys elegans]|uniref:Hydrophobin n=1 Tax=Stachybotrys elegans TaxID=80388 RepID=A0A8K0WZ76_9HYPO|nr:hypothetical protein B0I35DRAFT_474218 [Stachybotrys elegans]
MQFTVAFVAVALGATGAVAAPKAQGGGRPPNLENNYDSNNNNHNHINNQEISCSSASYNYCCSPGYTSRGSINYYDCYSFVGSCNAITVCCANGGQGGSTAYQQCSGLGSIPVVYH